MPRKQKNFKKSLASEFTIKLPTGENATYSGSNVDYLVAWYKFSNLEPGLITPGTRLKDNSPYAKSSGQYYGNVLFEKRYGLNDVGSYATFNQTYDSNTVPYIDIGLSSYWNSVLSTKKYTVSAWVKAISVGQSSRGTILQLGGQGLPGNSGIRLFLYSGNLQGKTKENSIAYRADFSSNDYVATSENNVFEYDTWFHIALSHDLSSPLNPVNIYVNGQKIQYEETHPSNNNPASGDFEGIIGGYQSSCIIGNASSNDATLNRLFDGSIHELAIWNTILDEESILALSNNSLASSSANQSGFLGHPVRIEKQHTDCLPLSYPSKARMSLDGLTGNEELLPYNDTNTIVFNSSHAKAWVYFYSRPADGSTLKLFDPAGDISLLTPIPHRKNKLSDLAVSSGDSSLVREQVYQVQINSTTNLYFLDSSSSLPEIDYPSVKGFWKGIVNAEGISQYYDLLGHTPWGETPDKSYRMDITLSSIDTIGPENLYDPESSSVGRFVAKIRNPDGAILPGSQIEFYMPSFIDEISIKDCEIYPPGASSETQENYNLSLYEGIIISWPNPFNVKVKSDNKSGATEYERSHISSPNANDKWTAYLFPPDKFRWRRASDWSASERTLKWQPWQPTEEGKLIGSGGICKNVIAKNLRYKNVNEDGYIYLDNIDLLSIDSLKGSLPSSVKFKIYAKGDLSASDNSEFYDIEYAFTKSDPDNPPVPVWVDSFERISSLKPSQTNNWSGPSAYAPFADGHKITEKELRNVSTDESGNPLITFMDDDPHITSSDIQVLENDTLHLRIKVGENVSWGNCQVKFHMTFSGMFLGVDGIDNNNASGNNIVLSWGNYFSHGKGDRWTINVEDSTSEIFEFNRGRITNPIHTEVKVNKSVKSRDQLNGLLAKAINKSGLQIEAVHDGDYVLLKQTVPGEIGNLKIFADARSRCHISNSKKYMVSTDDAVTGSFEGGSNYLVSYPTTLAAKLPGVDSNWLDHRVVSPNSLSNDEDRNLSEVGLISSGSTIKGVSDVGIVFSDKINSIKITPFKDSRFDTSSDDEYYAQGVPASTHEGFSSPLKSKISITIDLPTVDYTMFGLPYRWHPFEAIKYFPMVYYNFSNKKWEHVGPGVIPTPSNKQEQLEFFENACIGFSRGVELIQSSSSIASLPINDFGFPMHPKFEALPDQTFDLSSYIEKPFALEKFVVEYEAEWKEGNSDSKISVMYDVDENGKISRTDISGNYNNKAAINNFFILNQRNWIGEYEYNSIGRPVKLWYPPKYNLNVEQGDTDITKNRYMWNEQNYEYNAAENLSSWFRFISGTLHSHTSPDLALQPSAGFPDNATQVVLDSPWEIPGAAPTDGYQHSLKFSQGTRLQESLENLLNLPDDVTNYLFNEGDGDTLNNVFWDAYVEELVSPSTGIDYSTEAPGPNPGDAYGVLYKSYALGDNKIGDWDYAFAFKNTTGTDPAFNNTHTSSKNTSIFLTTKLGGNGATLSISYLYMQGKSSIPDLNEAPDPDMESYSTSTGENYRSEALRFQIAYCKYYDEEDAVWRDPNEDLNAQARSLSKAKNLNWIDINVHEPDYTLQGQWQEGTALIDQDVYFGAGDGLGTKGFYIRFKQDGTSGYPDTWTFTDVSTNKNPSFSMSLWFKTGTGSKNMNLISIVDSTASPNKVWLSIAKSGHLKFLLDSGQNRVYTKIKTLQPVNDNSWHNAIITYSNTKNEFSMYVDGIYAGSTPLQQQRNQDGEYLWQPASAVGPTQDPVTVTTATVTRQDVYDAGILFPGDEQLTQPESSSLLYTFTGEEQIEIGGILVNINQEEYMSKLGYAKVYAWKFKKSDLVVLGADADPSSPGLSYDNHFIGNISDFVVWYKELKPLDAKALYAFRSGYYKKGLGNNISLKGTVPTKFDVPLTEDFTALDGLSYELSNKLLSRYIIEPKTLQLKTSGAIKASASVVGRASYHEDSPYEVPANAVLEGGLKYCLGLGSGFVKLPRLNTFFPLHENSTAPDFSFFAWIKISDIDVNNPVIFSLNGVDGSNRLAFMIDTADDVYVRSGVNASKPKGLRLKLLIKSEPTPNSYGRYEDLDHSGGQLTTSPAAMEFSDTGFRKLSNYYSVLTNDVRQGGTYEVDDDEWHLVGFTHQIVSDLSEIFPNAEKSKFSIFFDGIEQAVHIKTKYIYEGPANDISLYEFPVFQFDPSNAGYHEDIWSDPAYVGSFTNHLGDTFTWQRAQYGYASSSNSIPQGISMTHAPLPFYEDDRVSVGQEYDIARKRIYSVRSSRLRRYTNIQGSTGGVTNFRKVRSYRTISYRKASQLFPGKITDISVWNSNLSSLDASVLYSSRSGENKTQKWFASPEGTARDLVTFGQWCIHGSTTESSTNIDDVLSSGLSRESNTPATQFSEVLKDDNTSYVPSRYEFTSYEGDPNTMIHVSGSFKLEGISKRPVNHSHGLSYRVGKGYEITSHQSIYKTKHNGTRSGQDNDIFSARALFNATPGSNVISEHYDFGTERRGIDQTKTNIFENNDQISPYVLKPSDKLVFGWQSSLPHDFEKATLNGSGPHMVLAPNATPENPTKMKVTLYGSYIKDGKERHEDLNQNLTSDAIHESIQYDTPIHDEFQTEDIGYLAGSYTDDVIKGEMLKTDAYAISLASQRGGFFVPRINRQKIGSVSGHTQGADSSQLKGVRLVDERERYFDTIVPRPADYHQFNGNGIIEWSSPLFAEGKKMKSLCVGEPRPSDIKISRPEITNIACQQEGWHEPVPQGVVKLTFKTLWTAHDNNNNNDSRYVRSYKLIPKTIGIPGNENGTWPPTALETDYVNTTVDSPWGIESEFTSDFVGIGNFTRTTAPSDNHDAWLIITGSFNTEHSANPSGFVPTSDYSVSGESYYTHYSPNAGKNYMFTDAYRTLQEVSPGNLEPAYFIIYDANSDPYYINLRWDTRQAIAQEISTETNITNIDLSGWKESINASNPWVNVDKTDPADLIQGNSSFASVNELYDSIKENGWDSIFNATHYAGTSGGANSLDIHQLWPSSSKKLLASNLATKIAEQIDALSPFEVLKVPLNDGLATTWGEALQQGHINKSVYDAHIASGGGSGALYSGGSAEVREIYYHDLVQDDATKMRTCSIYIKTVAGGLTSVDHENLDAIADGGGIPGLHYSSPKTSHVDLTGETRTGLSETTSNYTSGTPMIDFKFNSADLVSERVLIENGWGIVRRPDPELLTYSSPDNPYDISAYAQSIGLDEDIPGVSEYIQSLTPNNRTQFRHQYPVMETKNGFERVSGYTLNGCFMQIHDANDNPYNIWYNIDDGTSDPAPAPTEPGVLISVTSVLPAASAETVAKETAAAMQENFENEFDVTYEEGSSFFTVKNDFDGETKDADSTIMGLPLTTGFFLCDDSGEEYDNEIARWLFSWTSPGYFSFRKQYFDTESYDAGRTPEEPEVFWQGDPVQEGTSPYHKNTNNAIDSFWLGSYPFEPRYSSLTRSRYIKTSRSWLVTEWDDETGEFTETTDTASTFTSVIVTGSNIATKIQDTTIDGQDGYCVLPLLGSGGNNLNSAMLGMRFRGESVGIDNEFFKFYFGSGNTWQKNPDLEKVMIYSEGYEWPSYVPKIRGWKYGLVSALPENSSAVYRHDTYGQFRDMLEQRSDSRFFKTILRGSFKGRNFVTASPVRVRFVDEDGRLTMPEKTWSQNLSRFCTSSLPYFDDGMPRNRELDTTQLNTSFAIIED